MAGMALEYIFKILILTVVVLVLITFVYSIVRKSEERFNFCLPPFCKQQPSSCETKLINKNSIDGNLLKKYLNLCLETGRNLKKDCLCYTVKLTVPFNTTKATFSNSVVDECKKTSNVFLIEYKFGEDKVHLLC